MISYPLFKRNFIQSLKPLTIFVSILAMYVIVIVYMYDPKLMEMLTEYQKLMPEMMMAMGMSGASNSLIEFMETYLYGLLMTLLPFIFSIMMCNSFLTRYIDTGSLACILATPNSRKKIVITQALSLILCITLLMGISTVIGIASCQVLFPQQLDIETYLILNGCTLLLQFAIAGICFFAACLFNDAKQYYAFGAGIPLCFYLIKMLANMGEKLDVMKYFTIFSLLPTDLIVAKDPQVIFYNIALAVIGIVLFTGGILVFNRKDFSI